MQGIAREARMNSQVTFFSGPLHMDVPVLTDQQELFCISSVRTLDVVWKTCRDRWKSVLSIRFDDDDDDEDYLTEAFIVY